MNWKQIIVSISAFAVSAVIIWHALPIEFPGLISKIVILFVKLSVVLALAFFAILFLADKKNSS